MKKVIYILLLFNLCFITSGCGQTSSYAEHQKPLCIEQQKLGHKTIEVEILDENNYFTLGFPRKNRTNLLLKNEKYKIEEWYEDQTFGNMDMPNGWDYQEGETIKAEINYYYYPSNGKIVKAWIQEIY